MMVIDVACIALVFVVAATIIIANVVIARSECRTNRELLYDDYVEELRKAVMSDGD